MVSAYYGGWALNKFGQDGIELPSVEGKIDIKDAEIRVDNDAIVVAANFDFKI